MTALEPNRHLPAKRCRELDGVTVAILAVGLIPIVGFAVLGHWPQGDLGVGALFVLFAVVQLARHATRRR